MREVLQHSDGEIQGREGKTYTSSEQDLAGERKDGDGVSVLLSRRNRRR